MIYFIRHGETDFNLFGISQGNLNTSLNRSGLEQVAQLAKRLKDEPVDKIFCSPLNRAVQTALAINKYHDAPICFDDRLAEMAKGKLQGNINPQKVYNKFYKNPHKYGGETIEDVYARVKSFWDDLQKYKGKNIMVVSHGVIYRHFKFCYENRDIKTEKVSRDQLKNCEVKFFEF